MATRSQLVREMSEVNSTLFSSSLLKQVNQTTFTVRQLILTGVQLIKEIQGAQFLIHTSSGILTIMRNKLVGGQMLPHVTTNDQIFTTNNLQNVASSVGGASSTSALDDAITTQQLLPGRSCDPQVIGPTKAQIATTQLAAPTTQVTTPQHAIISSTPNVEIANTNNYIVDGINLKEIEKFAKAFVNRRLSLGFTQTQVGQALNMTEGPAYSQSVICKFEKLDMTPRSAQKVKLVLERWINDAEEQFKNNVLDRTEYIGFQKRKRRTSFKPQALDYLNQHFKKNAYPSVTEIIELARTLNYDYRVIQIWFCNKRQAQKRLKRHHYSVIKNE